MRVVLDTNVLIAGVVADGLCRNLVRRHAREHELFTSVELLVELAEKLKTKFGEDPSDLPLMAIYQNQVKRVKPLQLAQPICRDADDEIVLATALAAKADIIVTGDDDLLVLKQFQDIRILSPRQFLELLS